MSERLHKFLATQGFGSRREIERWIAEGRVELNGKAAQLGDQYQSADRVAIDGKDITARFKAQAPTQIIVYHKPQGQPLVRGDAETKESMDGVVQDHLPAVRGSRWIPINLMHPGDSGLLLLTNDGTLDYALTRRKRWIPTVYMVRVLAPGSAEAPPEIPLNVNYDDGVVEFTKVEPEGGEGANIWYRVELDRADRRAAVRALFESRNMKVSRMTQIAFGPIELPRNLPRMRHRALTEEQVAALYELARIKQPAPPEPQASEPRPRVGRGAQRGGKKQLRGPAPDRRKPARKRS
jgi:23S rRNA pseudouridine2605 synthase